MQKELETKSGVAEDLGATAQVKTEDRGAPGPVKPSPMRIKSHVKGGGQEQRR